MNLSDRLSSRPSSDHILSILQYLPIWTSVLHVTKQGQQRLHSVAAIDALLITDTDFFFPDLTPPHANCQFVAEVPIVKKLIERLGGRKLTPGDYAIKYVCPCLPQHPRDDQLLTISKFLGHLADVCENNPRVLKENVLIADRTGRLRFGRDLYINGNKIFDAAFEGKDDAFPHSLFEKLPLREFGVETSVTKANFIRCARNLEKEYRANEVERAALWTRCDIVWSRFNELMPYEDGWLGDLEELATIQFVPVLRNTTRPTYRDDHMRELIDSNVVSTMNEVLSPAFIPIAWTRRVFANTAPANFLAYIGFEPTIGDVVEHLVELATTFAAKCTMKEEKFFDDLAKTYDYLNQQERVLPASVYLLQRHLGKKVWLNEDLSLCDVSKFRKLGVPADAPISSLTWLSAKSILHGVPYDLPTYDLYSAKSSLEPYRNILRGCGSEVVENVKVVTNAESVENHGNYMLGVIRDMMTKQGNVYDMKIAIQGREFFAHRVLLGAVSTYFCRLCYGDWKEKSTGELDLDAETYGTAESVGSVIEWVYNGYLKLDDGLLPEDEVTSRLDHYLDILELSNVWDIVALRAHVENRILKYADKFVRVENVSTVMDTAGRYNAKVLKEFCEDFIAKNKRVVELVEGSPEPE
jgi:hypothetical protein